MAFGVGCYQHGALSWGYDFARMDRIKMARPRGFEPLAPRLGIWCSIRLSYGRLQDGVF